MAHHTCVEGGSLSAPYMVTLDDDNRRGLRVMSGGPAAYSLDDGMVGHRMLV